MLNLTDTQKAYYRLSDVTVFDRKGKEILNPTITEVIWAGSNDQTILVTQGTVAENGAFTPGTEDAPGVDAEVLAVNPSNIPASVSLRCKANDVALAGMEDVVVGFSAPGSASLKASAPVEQ